jgi:hypothetical protein
MTTSRERAEWYRKEAQSCFELAARMSLRVDRQRLTEMANHWLRLAELADAKAARGDDSE